MCGLFFQAQVKSFLFAHPQESGDDFFRGFYKAVLPTDDGRINQFNCSTPHVSFLFLFIISQLYLNTLTTIITLISVIFLVITCTSGSSFSVAEILVASIFPLFFHPT